MTPYFSDAWLTVYQGDARAVLAELPAESLHCVVTSPPYWGLRDYGVPGQLGLEPTPEAYVETMVAVFREVRRVLRADGTVWLNLGDSYVSSATNGEAGGSFQGERRSYRDGDRPRRGSQDGLKPKDLVGIPWRVAFALQADGWYLRSDIIWAKPNPMPESVTDRPTKSHEYLFLLSKSPRYYFDADAVREPHIEAHLSRYKSDFWPEGTKEANGSGRPGGAANTGGMKMPNPAGRNLRSVWTIATQPYPGQHFAVFPRKLVEPCVKAGTSERGVCPECGAPWERVVEREPKALEGGAYAPPGQSPSSNARSAHMVGTQRKDGDRWRTVDGGVAPRGGSASQTTGWRPTCRHDAEPIPATVLDPFAGSGTTGMVAQSLGRRAILIDLNADYLVQAMARNRDIPLGLGA